jgi:hypothetical protein
MNGAMNERGETAGQVLVEHWRGTVALDGARMDFVARRPSYSLVGSWVLIGFGLLMSVVMVVVAAGAVVRGGGFDPLMLLSPLWGGPFVILGAVYVRLLGRRWGTVRVDGEARTLVWRQEERVRGSWSLGDCVRIRSDHAFLSTYRWFFRQECWLVADMRDGTKVTLMLGTAEERRLVQDVLARISVPC